MTKTLKPQDTEHGEGNYRATRDYNAATKKFVQSGQVDEAARAAAPRDAAEQRDLEQAEAAGRQRSRATDASRAADDVQMGTGVVPPANVGRRTPSK